MLRVAGVSEVLDFDEVRGPGKSSLVLSDGIAKRLYGRDLLD